MRHTMRRALATLPGTVLCLFVCASAHASDTVPGPGIGSVLQMIVGLAVVLAAFFGVVWLIKRSGALNAGGKQVLTLVSSLAVGTRERVVVIEVGGQWIVAGVAPGSVNQLACLPRGEPAVSANEAGTFPAPAASFSGFLKQVMEKRNAK